MRGCIVGVLSLAALLLWAEPMRTEANLPAAKGAALAVLAQFDPKGGHVQGMCSDGTDYYLTQMTGIFKVDGSGRPIKSIKAISHTGDVCWHDGKLYSSVSVYDGADKGKGKIQVFDADLNLVRERTYPRGMDGIAFFDGKLYVGRGSHLETVPPGPDGKPQSKTPHLENEMAIVDPETLELLELKTYGHGRKTKYGAQNLATDGKLLYVSFYPGEKDAPDLVAYDKDLKPVRSFNAKASNGLEFAGLQDGTTRFIKCETVKKDGRISARIVPVELKPPAVAN